MKLLRVIFQRATSVSSALLYVTLYSFYRRHEPEKSRELASSVTLERAKRISNVDWLIRKPDDRESDADTPWVKQVLQDNAVRDALVRVLTVRRVIYQWAKLEQSPDNIKKLEEAMGLLESPPLAESPWDLLSLRRSASKRLKALRRELAEADRAEAEGVVYSTLFPKRLSVSELLQLSSIVSFAYLVGSYVFTTTVFRRLDSKVVGLDASDYVYFATSHNFWTIPLLLFGAWLVLPENISKAKRAYLSEQYGTTERRFTSFDAAAYVALAALNIPVFQWLIGVENESWADILLFDGVLLLIIAAKQFPFEKIFEQWYATHIVILFSLLLVGQMGMRGWAFAGELKQQSETDWQYTFESDAVTSSDYSFVFKGDVFLVFYEREGGKFLLKDVESIETFAGKH